ncbi:MAG TPA: S8 family serine peptidase, partial [Phycicoccus sp.]
MRRRLLPAIAATAAAALGLAWTGTTAQAAVPDSTVNALCQQLYGATFGTPNGEPLGACQWDMALIHAGDESYAHATGKGVTIGVIDSGVDLTHPDIAPNLDLGLSCSFIYSHDPVADPSEVGNGDCSNKAAIQDLYGHGTHVASTIAAPVNGVGIAGVAPEATIVALKACSVGGYCFADSVAAALRRAGDLQLDVVNMSLFADPYLYYCKNATEQR